MTRREFLGVAVATAATGAWRPALARFAPSPHIRQPRRLRFAVIGLNHGHINGQVETVTRAGGQLVSFFAKEPDLAAAFAKRFPSAKLDGQSARYIDCSDVALPHGERLVDDVLNRTETANPQAQTFLAMEVALRAQKQAQRVRVRS